MDDFARVDNLLSASQTDIGESSNLAQLAQSYACNFPDEKYEDAICTMSVLAQVAIDSSKRMFDVNVANEIKRIKKDLNVKENKYPSFWKIIHKNFNENNIDRNLICPMNYLYNLKFNYCKNKKETIPTKDFIIKQPFRLDKRTCKKVEKMMCDYLLYKYQTIENNENDYLLLRSDFDSLINSIRETPISSNYNDFMFWLLDRIFGVNPRVAAKRTKIKNKLNKNRSIMIKTLYLVNKNCFLDCFVAKK